MLSWKILWLIGLLLCQKNNNPPKFTITFIKPRHFDLLVAMNAVLNQWNSFSHFWFYAFFMRKFTVIPKCIQNGRLKRFILLINNFIRLSSLLFKTVLLKKINCWCHLSWFVESWLLQNMNMHTYIYINRHANF